MSAIPEFHAVLSYTLRDSYILVHAGGEFIGRAPVSDTSSARAIDEAICTVIEPLPCTYMDPRQKVAEEVLRVLHKRTPAPFSDNVMTTFDLDDGLFGCVTEITVGCVTFRVRSWYEAAIGSRLRLNHEIINPVSNTVIVPRCTSLGAAVYQAYGLAWADALYDADH